MFSVSGALGKISFSFTFDLCGGFSTMFLDGMDLDIEYEKLEDVLGLLIGILQM